LPAIGNNSFAREFTVIHDATRPARSMLPWLVSALLSLLLPALSSAQSRTERLPGRPSAGSDCAHPPARVAFDVPLDYETGPLPVSVAIGDFDGDGLPDFATACDLAVVTVHHNRGGGEFDEPRYIQASGAGVHGVAAGDLDGDGRDDLVAATWLLGSHSVVVYHGGEAGFTAEEDYALPDQPTSVAIGDMDGDGLPDLVVTGGPDLYLSVGSRVWIFRNLGKGLFDRSLSVAVGSDPRSVVLADFDSDGRLDFADVNYGLDDKTISVAHNKGSLRFEVSTIALDFYPTAIAAGEMNGDGAVDLVTIGSDFLSGDRARLLMNRGDGSFSAAGDLPVGQNAQSLGIGDVDGDGANDVVVGNVTGAMISVFRGLGDGTFETRVDWPFDDGPYALALGDMNLDGALDLIVTRWFSRGVSVWPNATPLLARVDVRVGDPGNHVSERSSGQVSVGIFGGEQLDVHSIDLESIRINGNALADPIHGGAPLRFVRLDGDAFDDVVLSVPAATVSASQDGCVLISGKVRNGPDFQGGDAVRIVGFASRLNVTDGTRAEPDAEGQTWRAGQNLRVIASKRGEVRLAVRVSGTGGARVEVFNVRGARVAGERVSPGVHELSLRGMGLGVGLYLVRLSDDSGVACSKVMIPSD
jgi:hypothetical protein